jgi:hypothetical protein
MTPMVYVASLDSSERQEVGPAFSRMVYSSSGRVLYAHEGALLAQRFDLRNQRLTGEPIRIAENLDYYRSTGAAAFSISDAGVLAYHGGAGQLELVWFDRSGKVIGSLGSPQRYGAIRISPDGERVAVEVVDARVGTSDIWIYDVTRGVGSPLSTDLSDEIFPVWSPDAQRMTFGSDRGAGSRNAASDLFTRALNGIGNDELLFSHPGFQIAEDWSPDGRSIAYTDDNPETGNDLWILPLVGDRTPQPLFRTRSTEWGARFSPDSAWVAFVSDESGTNEVYLAPLQGSAAKTRVSTAGGGSPRWRRDGTELFYLSSDGRSVLAAPITWKPTFKIGTAVRLFTLGVEPGFRGRGRNIAFDVSPDGQRFLFNVATGNAGSRLTVVLNWTAALNR